MPSGLADRLLVHSYATNISYLTCTNVGIEEIAGLEEWICYDVRMRIERAVPL